MLKQLFFLVLFFRAVAFGQTDTLNRFNAADEKDGWWIVYLDENLKEIKDSTKATHIKYTY